jgi:hypothetical protein
MTLDLQWTDFENYLKERANPAKPVPPDRGILFALMLWPDDITMRVQSANRAFLNYYDDLTNAPIDVINFGYQVARDSVGAAELEKAEEERAVRGLFVGSVLHSMTTCEKDSIVNFAHHVNKCNRGFLAVRNDKGKNQYRFSKKTFDNDLWPTFRRVSHYWAAAYKHLQIDLEDELPCALDKLQMFLAYAGFIRAEAEVRRPFKSPSTLLRAGEALMLPWEYARNIFSRDKRE